VDNILSSSIPNLHILKNESIFLGGDNNNIHRPSVRIISLDSQLCHRFSAAGHSIERSDENQQVQALLELGEFTDRALQACQKNELQILLALDSFKSFSIISKLSRALDVRTVFLFLSNFLSRFFF
jgi:hypothetical protein